MHDTRVFTQNELSWAGIEGVASDRFLAYRVPNYIAPEAGKELFERLRRQIGIEWYSHEPTVGMLGGTALVEAKSEPERLFEYVRQAATRRAELRRAAGDIMLPIDRFRLQLSELAPTGANLALVAGRPAYSGIVRVYGVGAEAHPHQDEMRPELGLPESRVLSAVAYLTVGEAQDGELDLWGSGLDSETYLLKRGEQRYGVERTRLADPVLTIQPRSGDLIVFRADQLHAVRRTHTMRITESCFVAYPVNAASTLILWA